MSITNILFDLDDTLLCSNINQFIPIYLQQLGKAIQPFTPNQNPVQLVLQSTAAMQANTNPEVTNQQVFYNTFMPNLTGNPAEIHSTIEVFYRTVYPTLRTYTIPNPAARPLMDYLFNHNYRVAIATNPLFPQTAIYQRLEWAGVGDFPFDLVTTMETMSFSKPSLDYYKAILSKINAPADQTMMVGNDPDHDIIPAQQLGMATWWATDYTDPNATPPTNTLSGTLADLHHWLKTTVG